MAFYFEYAFASFGNGIDNQIYQGGRRKSQNDRLDIFGRNNYRGSSNGIMVYLCFELGKSTDKFSDVSIFVMDQNNYGK